MGDVFPDGSEDSEELLLQLMADITAELQEQEQAALAAHQHEVLATARSTPPHRVRRQLLDAQLAEQVPALEAAVQSQAVELAEARAQLATLAAQAQHGAKSSADELRAKSRQLEEAERRWRNHQHDGETKLRLLEEQVRASDGL